MTVFWNAYKLEFLSPHPHPTTGHFSSHGDENRPIFRNLVELKAPITTENPPNSSKAYWKVEYLKFMKVKKMQFPL
jgi:hypothetical protein